MHHALHGNCSSRLILALELNISWQFSMKGFLKNETKQSSSFCWFRLPDIKSNLRYFHNRKKSVTRHTFAEQSTTHNLSHKLRLGNVNDKTNKLLQLIQRNLPMRITWNSVSFSNSTFLDVSLHRLVEKKQNDERGLL